LNRAYDILRSGAWVTPQRIRLVATTILCVAAASVVFLLVTAHGLVDVQGRPLGTDFSSFYSAGTYVLEGNAQAPYDLARQHAREQAILARRRHSIAGSIHRSFCSSPRHLRSCLTGWHS
jgi:hypothetical protein